MSTARAAHVRSETVPFARHDRYAPITGVPARRSLGRSRNRQTKRRPDQVASIAQTLLSTRPAGQADLAHDVLVEVGRDAGAALRPGDPEPAGGLQRRRERRELRAHGRRSSAKSDRRRRRRSRPARTNSTPGGSSPSVAAKPSGAPTSSTRLPSRMPSLRGSGVPEYPAVLMRAQPMLARRGATGTADRREPRGARGRRSRRRAGALRAPLRVRAARARARRGVHRHGRPVHRPDARAAGSRPTTSATSGSSSTTSPPCGPRSSARASRSSTRARAGSTSSIRGATTSRSSPTRPSSSSAARASSASSASRSSRRPRRPGARSTRAGLVLSD